MLVLCGQSICCWFFAHRAEALVTKHLILSQKHYLSKTADIDTLLQEVCRKGATLFTTRVQKSAHFELKLR
jgi:hypothetical protein